MSKKPNDSTQWWPFSGMLVGLSFGILADPLYGWSLGGLLGLSLGFLLAGLSRSQKH